MRLQSLGDKEIVCYMTSYEDHSIQYAELIIIFINWRLFHHFETI